MRRRPIERGDTVRHMDAREGTVCDLAPIRDGELTHAVVQFDDGSRIHLAVGYLEQIPAALGLGGLMGGRP